MGSGRAVIRRTKDEGRRTSNSCTHALMQFCTLFSVLCALALSGCGYTTKTLLPAHVKNIYIQNFKNSIDLTEEYSNKRPYKLYKAGLENEITRAIGDRFILDGNLKVVKNAEEADSVLSGELLEYVREPLRYDKDDNVTEFRVRVVASAKFLDKKTNKAIWQSGGLAGESSQRTEGTLVKTEDTARAEAVEDFSRRVVEKTIEVW